jgi:hypothetical protein
MSESLILDNLASFLENFKGEFQSQVRQIGDGVYEETGTLTVYLPDENGERVMGEYNIHAVIYDMVQVIRLDGRYYDISDDRWHTVSLLLVFKYNELLDETFLQVGNGEMIYGQRGWFSRRPYR